MAPLLLPPRVVSREQHPFPWEASMDERQILVLDDEPAIRDVFDEALSNAGYTVVQAARAEEALGILKQKNIHVMFVDIRLPGMSGLEFCTEIRKHNPVAIIYAMTGYVELFELSDCRQIGFDDYLHKPVRVKLMLRLAEDAFEKLERWSEEGSPLLPVLK